MFSIAVLVATYVLGGLTLIPLLLLVLFVYSSIALPRQSKTRRNNQTDELLTKEEADEDNSELKAKLEDGNHEADVAASYFAVCREYVPGGINGKPPERTTPAGETIAGESPSVYQSMYRSIFDRHKSQTPTIESGKSVKKARNVFYVVLRHGHLMLFDDADQIEVRHVIALAHYNVDIYAGGDRVLEGELYIKRNSIRLSRKKPLENATATLAPFYLFSDNCSDKEDFYHALISSQRKMDDSPSDIPVSQEFEAEDMIKLIRFLHVSDDNLQMRWLNALLGRIFLAVYKTSRVEDLVRKKIKKKIARVRKPAFLTSLTLDDISMGESAPNFHNMRLKDLNVDGTLTVEADVKYSGKFKAVISAVAKIEFGQHFKPREVDLVLAGVLNRLDGHILIRVKPPPSNRFWISFETMPKIETSIEPVVSSRQITYGVIIRAIESRIREVFAETLVYPNWDDFPFTNTESQQYRGGIWKEAPSKDSSLNSEAATAQDTLGTEKSDVLEGQDPGPSQESITRGPYLRTSKTDTAAATTSNLPSLTDSSSQPSSPLQAPPVAMRSNSFAAPAIASSPVLTKIPVASDKNRKREGNRRRDAASAMKRLSSRSQESSPRRSPSRLPLPLAQQATTENGEKSASGSELADEQQATDDEVSTDAASEGPSQLQAPKITLQAADVQIQRKEVPSQAQATQESPLPGPMDRRDTLNQTISSATAAAKKWGLGVMQRSKDTDETKHARSLSGPISEPMGRGQPLPPPGEPLPRPEPKGWASTFGSFKRKPVPGSSITSLPPLSDLLASHKDMEAKELGASKPNSNADADGAVPSGKPSAGEYLERGERTTSTSSSITGGYMEDRTADDAKATKYKSAEMTDESLRQNGVQEKLKRS